jgi:hypothetical protein
MRDKKLILPARNDPRYYILLFLAAFVVYALTSPGYQRTPLQYLVALGVCLGLDFALCWAKGLLMVPLSAFVTSMGTLLLCDSPKVWPYALVAALSILSKHWIKSNGKHVFNPNNFGVIVAVLLFPAVVTIVPGRWGGNPWGIAAIFALGWLVAYKARRAGVAGAYIGAFAAGVLIRHLVYGANMITLAAPMTGAGFQLFTFYMVTDPKTSPASLRGQLAFGAVVGALDSALRQQQVNNAPFLALFILTGAMPLVRHALESLSPSWRRMSWEPR